MKTVLIFEAHADDCVIGMGGTIQNLKEEGFKVVVVTFTLGETAYSNINLKENIANIRLEENKKAFQIIGVDEHITWDYPTQGIVDSREVHQRCIEVIRKYRPEIIFTHYYEDKHRDHRAISNTVTEAWWKASEGVLADKGEPYKADKLYYFEVTELFTHPDVVIDITPYFEKKIEAINQYKSQVDVMPGFMDYVEGVAKARGFYSRGLYGEAFMKSNFLPTNHL